jgi:hypothetical protein
MPYPFPGMNPWLERPGLWPDVHDNLILGLQRTLAPLVSPRYYIAVKQRTVFAVVPAEPKLILPDVSVVERDRPFQVANSGVASMEASVLAEPIIVDVPVRETIPEDYLEIVEAATEEVVTVIELLSLSNKMPGKDRRAYEYKRERIFRTLTHLVEIDLLRDGDPMPFTFLQTNGYMSHYRILVKRSEYRHAYLYPFGVRDPIPVFPLPLQPGDTEPPIRLGELLKALYDQVRYDLRVDYSQPPTPPLSEADTMLVAEILRA